MVTAKVSHVVVNDGTRIDFPPSGVILVVGPNNAGKSQFLRELRDRLKGEQTQIVLTNLHLVKDQSGLDLNERLPIPYGTTGSELYYIPGWGAVPLDQIQGMWHNSGPSLNLLADLFVLHADGSSRLTGAASQSSVDLNQARELTPLQKVYVDSDLEHLVNASCVQAFGLQLVLDRHAGATICLRVGPSLPKFDHVNGVPTRAYLDALRVLPQLDNQGDGIKAYMGLALMLIAGTHDIVLVDEPEAFLHPPQARMLGRVIADKAATKQAVIATHSTDMVQGVLQTEQHTTVLRITREAGLNRVATLDNDALKQLWSDSLLRQSNVLDGLFHDVVVICESDSDCRYYSSVMDYLPMRPVGEEGDGTNNGTAPRSPEVLFTYSSTKSRMALIAKAMAAVKVPVVVIADFDLLRDEKDLRPIVEIMGGSYDEVFKQDQTSLNSALAPAKPMLKTALQAAVEAAFDKIEGETVNDKQATQLRAVIRGESGWDKAKSGGVNSLPSGDASTTALRLLSNLKAVGVLVVPVGELERFEKTVGNHGPKWVAEVLERDLHKTPSDEAKKFVGDIRELASVRSGLTAG